MAAEEDGALVVELLGNDRNLLQAKDIAGAHDGVERTKAGAVAIHSVGGDACLQQGFFEVRGLVVALDVVVATYQQVIDFARLKKLGGSAQAAIELDKAVNIAPIGILHFSLLAPDIPNVPRWISPKHGIFVFRRDFV